MSESFPVSNGIKQGGILSPKLFNIYVDALSSRLKTRNIGCCVNGTIINHLYYADDLVLISPSLYGLQVLLKDCEVFSKNYDLKFNEMKSYFLYFKPYKFKVNPHLVLYMNGSVITPQHSCKYLGHVIYDNLCDNDDIRRQLRSFYGKSNLLLRTFGSCTAEVKQHMFMSYCSSFYTAHLWCEYTKKQYKQLQVAYNNVFRKLLGYDRFCSASDMFVTNRVDTFDVRIRRLIFGFRDRLRMCENTLITCMNKSDAFRKSPLVETWSTALYLN